MPEWKTVSIRQELVKEVEELIKRGRYRSVSEFVAEAIRLRLEELMRLEGVSAEKRRAILAAPEQVLYTSKHTWAQITPEGNIRVGVSDYAQRHLKGIARVLTEPVGKDIKQMEPFGMIETWMFVFDLYAPVSGKIVSVNNKLEENPQLINEDPYGEGWIIEIKPKNSVVLEEELSKLMSPREYHKMISKIEGRMRE